MRALGAMAAASQRARQSTEWTGPPTGAWREPDVVPPPAAADDAVTARRRNPLEVAVWVVAALVLVAAGALAVSLGTGGSGTPTAPGPVTASAPRSGGAAPARRPTTRGSTVTTSTSTTTTAAPAASGPPVIASLSPSSGSAGQVLAVGGSNFLSSSGQIIATFNGQVAPTSCPAPNTCSVTVPPSSGGPTAQVVITTAGGTSNPMTFTYS
jgi:hypothetical protein